jgi:hypothetical protein
MFALPAALATVAKPTRTLENIKHPNITILRVSLQMTERVSGKREGLIHHTAYFNY